MDAILIITKWLKLNKEEGFSLVNRMIWIFRNEAELIDFLFIEGTYL